MPIQISDLSRIKENRGKIDLVNPENYIPWIKTRDCVSGEGTRHIVPDLYYKNRTIHLMSDLEKDVYFTLRSKEHIIEIFEQFPLLPVKKTETICDSNGIKHPFNPKLKQNIVMTTDFLLLVKNEDGEKWVACAVKPAEKMEQKRTREKLYAERMYWEDKHIKWGVITEKQINKTYVNNVILCSSGYVGIGNGSMYDILKYLIVQKIIEVDMYKPVNLNEIITGIRKGKILLSENVFNEKRQNSNRFQCMVDFKKIRDILFNY